MDSKRTMLRVGLLLVALSASVASHTWHTGRTCPEIDAFTNLSMDKVLGIWYVVYQTDTSNTCLVWNVTKVDEDRYTVTETRQLWMLDAISVDHQHHVTAQLDLPNPEVPARMRVRWPTSLTGKADFTVFDTDHTNYMAVFECDRAGLLHRQSVTILSRASVMNQIFVDRIRRLLDKKKIAHNALNIVEHNTCRDKGQYNWHTDGELFGIIRPDAPRTQEQRLGTDLEDYDVSQLEILGDGVEHGGIKSFSGSIKAPRRV